MILKTKWQKKSLASSNLWLYVKQVTEKEQLFNSYFSEQCILLKNISILPNTCYKYTKYTIDIIAFSKEDNYKLIKKLELNKVHVQHMISIRMLKISKFKALEIIFWIFLCSGKSPSKLKKANAVSISKKGGKKSIKIIPQLVFLPSV